MGESLLEAAQSKVSLADGAIGTELLRLGLDSDGFGEAWNIERPDRVLSIHKAYCDAGARVLTTNSFRGNRRTLEAHGLEGKVREINRCASEVARSAANGAAWVLGSIGPFGGFVEPLGTTSAGEAFSLFEEQASALLEGGADGIVIETMTAKEELEIAIRAARAAGAQVVAALMTFGKTRNGYRTMMGVSPQEAVEVGTAAGADFLGSNCGQGLSMSEYAEIVSQFRSFTRKPVIIRPNAGRPDLLGEKVQYHQTPAMMADQVCELVHAGANVVGGCCGTTPDHIRRFREALERM